MIHWESFEYLTEAKYFGLGIQMATFYQWFSMQADTLSGCPQQADQADAGLIGSLSPNC